MTFTLRQHYRFPVFNPVKYEVRLRTGYGTLTNLSTCGWRIAGSVPVQPGDVCSLTVRLPTMSVVAVVAGKVRWVRGTECGIETLVMSDESQEQLNTYIQARIKTL
jgi:hypothetical protein